MTNIDELIANLSPGDHIFTWGDTREGHYSPVVHHGVYVKEGKVIHYVGGKKNEEKLPIKKTSLSEFMGSKDAGLGIVEYSECSPSDVVVSRALERLNEQNYQLITNNCEHFAFSCKTGSGISYQIFTGGFMAIGLLGMLFGKKWAGVVFHAPRMVNDMLLLHGKKVRIIQESTAPRIGYFSEWNGYIGQIKDPSRYRVSTGGPAHGS